MSLGRKSMASNTHRYEISNLRVQVAILESSLRRIVINDCDDKSPQIVAGERE